MSGLGDFGIERRMVGPATPPQCSQDVAVQLAGSADHRPASHPPSALYSMAGGAARPTAESASERRKNERVHCLGGQWRESKISGKMSVGLNTRTSNTARDPWRGGGRCAKEPWRALLRRRMRLGGRTNLAFLAGSGAPCPVGNHKSVSACLTSRCSTPGCPVRPPGNGLEQPS